MGIATAEKWGRKKGFDKTAPPMDKPSARMVKGKGGKSIRTDGKTPPKKEPVKRRLTEGTKKWDEEMRRSAEAAPALSPQETALLTEKADARVQQSLGLDEQKNRNTASVINYMRGEELLQHALKQFGEECKSEMEKSALCAWSGCTYKRFLRRSGLSGKTTDGVSLTGKELNFSTLDTWVREECGIPIDRPDSEQETLLKSAKRAYIILLNNPRYANNTFQYTCYLDMGNGEPLRLLCPAYHEDEKEHLLPYQEHQNRNKEMPPFLFMLGGCGYSKPTWLAMAFNGVNPYLPVYELHGYHISQRNNGGNEKEGFGTWGPDSHQNPARNKGDRHETDRP